MFFCTRGDNSDKVTELTDSGDYYGTPIKKMWSSTVNDFGYLSSKKIIKEIFILTKYDCVLKVITPNKTKDFVLKGSDLPQRIRVNIVDSLIGISIQSDCRCADISRVTIRFGV